MSRLARAVLAAVVVLVLGAAIVGIGMGDAPATRERAPSAARVAAAERRIAAGAASVRAGRRAFEDEGCDRCHSIAAIGAGDKLGPRLDKLDDDLDDIAESIGEPRDDIVDGYAEELMPTDYERRLGAAKVRALAAFIATAAGTEEDEGRDDDRRGRGGRGRSRGHGG